MSGRADLRGVLARGERIATRAAEERRHAIARAAEQVPGVNAAVDGEAVVLSGRGLAQRWLGDMALREIGSAGR